MTVLVTGAGGWIGSRVLPALRAAGPRAVGVHRRLARDASTAGGVAGGSDGPPPEDAVRGDLLDPGELARIVGSLRPSAVVHLAGLTRGEDGPAALYRANVESSANLAQALVDHAPEAHLVVLGSAAEYGPARPGEPITEEHPCRPAGHYGLSKHLQTELLRGIAGWRGLPVTVLRAFNTVGPGMPPGFLLSDLFERLRRLRAQGGGDLEVADLEAVRDLVPLDRVVATIVAVVRRRAPLGIYNVATGVPTRVGEVVEWLREASDFAWQVRPGRQGGPRRGVSWSVGSPVALERELGTIETPSAREAVIAAFRADVLQVEETS